MSIIDTYTILWAVDIRKLSLDQLNGMMQKFSLPNGLKFRNAYMTVEKHFSENSDLFELMIKMHHLTEESLFHPDNKFILANSVIHKVKA